MQKYYNKKRKLNKLKASLLLLMLLCFAGAATAQQTTIWMKEGRTELVAGQSYKFYDSHGPSEFSEPMSDGNGMRVNYWDKWYSAPETYTHTFVAPGSAPYVKVTFHKFKAYTWTDEGDYQANPPVAPYNCQEIPGGQWALRLNDDVLYVYEGTAVDDNKLIGEYTGNTQTEFVIMAQGAITFKFVSNSIFREEGWDATVTSVNSLTPQAPFIRRSTCNDAIELMATTFGATIYYTTNGNDPSVDPLNGTQEWDGTPIQWGSGNLTVKAMSVVGGHESEITTRTFTDADRIPNINTADYVPGLIRVPNTNTVRITCPDVPAGLNETFVVYYTDGINDVGAPSPSNYSMKLIFVDSNTDLEPDGPKVYNVNHSDTYEFECTNPQAKFQAVVYGYSCDHLHSPLTEVLDYGNILVDAPVISFTTTNPTDGLGTATITCPFTAQTPVIYYTTDGSEPNPDNVNAQVYSGPFAVTAGTTVKAKAVVSLTGYNASATVSNMFVPTNTSGEPQNGVFGSVVLLDDREPHTWSYYSDGDQPVHSLNPADVKITYYGYGNNTMTTTDIADAPTTFNGNVAAADVAVGHNAPGNQFIFMKTLENANEAGTGNYPYTMIPNPFSKRPTYENAPTTRTIYLVTTGNNNGRGTLTVTYTNANGQGATETVDINSSYFSDTRSITAKVGGTITYSLQRTAGTVRSGAYYDTSDGTEIWYVTRNNNGTSTPTNPYTVQANTSSDAKYRGFYAWRVKRLSSGLKIKVNGTEYNSTSTNIPPIMAETEVEFVTTNAEGNEVDFEALWAQAYVVTSNTATGLHAGVSYERNFVVGAAPNDALNVPVTYSRYNPDGTGGANTVNIGTFTCAADTKFEYMNLNNGTLTANNHDLIMGRGLTGTAAMIQGINGNANNGLDYMLRVESGTYTELSFVRSSGATVSGRYLVKSILGCDYDRATENNGNLTVSNNTQLFFSQSVTFDGSENKDQKTFDLVVKGGQYQRNIWNGNNGANNTGAYNRSFYCGQNQAGNTYPGMRYVTVEGGEFASMNGGRGVGGTSTTYASPDVVTFDLRIKNGTFHGSVFGAAADNPSIGSRRMVITGGEILGWVAAGANGTGSVGSSHAGTDGNSYIYVGGNSIVGSTNPPTINETEGGNVFGAGRGRENQKGSMVNSNVVVADNTVIFQNVYGGGFNGYIENTSNVYVLGGTVKQNVFGGGYNHSGNYNNAPKNIPTSNVYVKGGTVNGSVYGGSNSSGTVVNSHVTVTGSEEISDVFGGGYGENTNIGQSTTVVVSGGALHNVYGGGSLGTVTGNTDVTVSGGTVENVYGAGLGNTNSWPITQGNANISGNTNVTINGGTVNQSVYGGGENGTVAFQTGGATHANLASTVSVSGGLVKGDVFGGGREGTTQARTIVNINGGEVGGNVFGGAYGIADRVYVAGPHTVNISGHTGGGYPFIKGCVYGGSRLANDGQSLTLTPANFDNSSETALSSVINISGGRVKEHVYAAGYYGRCFGSCYVNIGSRAVETGPYNTDDKAFQKSNVYIQGSVWAGGDWGTFAGEFGKSTISGNTSIYLDGEGYDTESTVYTDPDYMGIGSSILGCGTSCDAGKADRHFVMRNYGKMKTAGATLVNPVTGTTRELYSAQLFTKVFIDASHITFKGQGKMNELNVTEKYSLFNILDDRNNMMGGVYEVNGSTLVLNAPASQIHGFHSATCSNTFAANPTCVTLDRDALYSAHLDGNDNKVRVNNGSYIEVKYDKTTNNTTETLYGEVDGYAHMMTSVVADEATCAYARPKNAVNSPIAQTYSNDDDGGFLSYDDYYNKYKQDGTLVEAGSQYELPYENHAPTRNDNEYFRVWRYGGGTHYVEGLITVNQVGVAGESGTAEYRTVDVTVQLPAWRADNAYYRFDRVDAGTSYYTQIDYGTDVISYNAACYGTTPGTNNWMYFQDPTQVTGVGPANCLEIGKLTENPDQNFGLIIMPGTAMASADPAVSNYIICSASDSYIAEKMKYTCSDYMKMPTVTFRLTYKNNINSNTTWDPVTIPLMQCVPNGNAEVEYELVFITLTVNTETVIESTFNTQLYATMKGQGTSSHQRLQGTIVLPTFDTDAHPAQAEFFVESAKFTQGIVLNGDGSPITNPSETDVVSYEAHGEVMDINKFGLTVVAVPTPDIMDDWRDVQAEFDCGPLANGGTATWNEEGYLGYAGGRNGLSIGFNLYYSDLPSVPNETLMGTLELGIRFTHFAEEGEGADNIGHFKVVIQVYRRGEGSNFYVDGNYGVDDTQVDRGLFPNYAAKTVEFVLSRLGYKPGDNIFIVNTVNVNKPLKWDGSKKQDDVNIWRYPGNHPLKAGDETHPVGPIQDNALNNAFTGVLFNVNQPLTMTSISVDGIYHEAKATEHRPKIYPTTPNPNVEGSELFDGVADAPLFVINDGGRVNLRSVSKLIYNCNGNDGTGENATYGGAVWVKKGGLLTMNETASITGNINTNGGGIYMDGGFVASSYAYVFNNFKAEAGSKAETQAQSNVWLTKGYDDDKYKCLQIGMEEDDAYNALLTSNENSAKIGLDKAYTGDAYKMDDYLPVVYTATSTINYLEGPYEANREDAGEGIIVHDKAKYKLEKYTPNNYLYWLSTWVTFQDHEPDNRLVDGVAEGNWEGVGNIHTPQQLAWFISLVNGENDATASTFAGQTINITDDISMDGHVWVPIGTPTHPFKGTFEGNGHVITDMYGSLIQTNMGMFGYTDAAHIQNAVMSTDFTGTNDNLGTVVGTMNGGTLTNVEGAGSILNKYSEANMGGLVGNNVGGTIHSSFAVADMKGGANMGGLVGKNTGNLYNAYSNVNFAKIDGQTSNMTVAGLVYDNAGTVQNCYVIEGSHTSGNFYPFAVNNTGNIDYCYAAKPAEGATVTYVGNGTQPTTHGTYDVVKARKEIGYMYNDNKTEKVGTGVNGYIKDEIAYANGRISTWPGLLSTLNQWVAANPKSLNPEPTTWFRPTSGDINGDLPVLGFTSDNSLATEDGKFLFYGSDVNANGLDNLFTVYDGKTANMFLYGNATDVTLGNGSNPLFINEDAVLIQKLAEGANDMATITATVGITFDNSCKTAPDLNGTTLTYDWHFMSSPLQDATIGATYDPTTGLGGDVNIATLVDSYFPNNLPMATPSTGVKWDFYTYYEPEYHWINLKRSGDNHWHQDNNDQIHYVSGQMVDGEPMGQDQNETIFVPGKGYMMAISQDSYMNSTGKLNNDVVTIGITSLEPEDLEYNLGWNLVGNPYQAYLDLEALFEDDANTGKATQAYVYDADKKVYVPFVTDASENPVVIQYLHQHQGFFVHSEAENATLTFKPDMATTTAAGTYFRGSEDKVNYPLVNLFAENVNGNRDLAVIEFNRPELGGATKVKGVRNANFQVSASLEGHRYGLVFTPEGTEKVPVHFITEENGTFTLTWKTLHGDFTSLLLVDNLTGTITDMLRADHYTFDATTDDYASRFYITYTVTGVDEYNEGDGTFAFFDGSEWIVEGKGMLDVVDVQGRTLYSERLVSDKNRVSLNGVAAGVYLLRVSDGTNTMVQKIVVK